MEVGPGFPPHPTPLPYAGEGNPGLGEGGDPLLRQTTYRFFAGLLLYPEPDRIEQLKSAASWLSDHDFPTSRLLDLSNLDLQSLQSDYVSLFVSNPAGTCAPYETAYAPSELAPNIAFGLECEYARAGLKLAVHDLPDHAGIELEFMSYLCRCQSATSEISSRHSPLATRHDSSWLPLQLTFLDQHLRKWFPAFSRRVEETTNGFYAEVCRAANDWISSDLARI